MARKPNRRGQRDVPWTITAAQQLYAQMRYRARTHYACAWRIPFVAFVELILRECVYCGQPPSNRHKPNRKHHQRPKFTYSGLDRLDSSRGYTLDNVVPCCRSCNTIKNNLLTPREMRAAMTAVKKLRK